MKKQIALLPGDGVGPEITEAAVTILHKIAEQFGHEFTFTKALVGAIAIDETGNPFPDETKKLCVDSDAILFGAIGDPKYDNDPSAKIRPEQGLLAMRKVLGLYANVRPIFTFKQVANKSPLKPEIIDGVDFVVIRELIGGIYFGKRGFNDDRTAAFDTAEYTKDEIIRVSKFAFELSGKRRKKLTVVDKANVLDTSRLWRETIQQMEKDYPEIAVDYLLVDNAAQQFIKAPAQFDVVVTENMFGDILTDEASVITGSLGMLPSASIGEKTSLFEPIHGSYPKAKGLNTANPIGTILSAAMLLEYSFGMTEESKAIYTAVEKTLEEGYGTKDITTDKILSTSDLGDKIIEFL